MVVDAERPAGAVELDDPVLAELVGEQVAQIGRDDLVTSVTRVPSAAYLAIVAPVPIDSSSGCACTSSRLLLTTSRLCRSPDLA